MNVFLGYIGTVPHDDLKVNSVMVHFLTSNGNPNTCLYLTTFTTITKTAHQ